MAGTVEIMGFIVAEARRQTGHIITMDVLPEARRAGIGSSLLQAAEDRLRQRVRPSWNWRPLWIMPPAISSTSAKDISWKRPSPGYYSNTSGRADEMRKDLARRTRKAFRCTTREASARDAAGRVSPLVALAQDEIKHTTPGKRENHHENCNPGRTRFFQSSGRRSDGATGKGSFRVRAHWTSSTVSRGAVGGAVIPIENSLAGSVAEHFDLLLSRDVHIVREFRLRIVHNLIALPARNFATSGRSFPIRGARSVSAIVCAQPQTRAGPVYDTAGSVKHVVADRLRDAAGIASRHAPRIRRQDSEGRHRRRQENSTRFFLIQTRQAAGSASSGQDLGSRSASATCGGSFKALSVFALRDISLSKIDRVNARTPLGILVFRGHCSAATTKAARNALHHLKEVAELVKVARHLSAGLSFLGRKKAKSRNVHNGVELSSYVHRIPISSHFQCLVKNRKPFRIQHLAGSPAFFWRIGS